MLFRKMERHQVIRFTRKMLSLVTYIVSAYFATNGNVFLTGVFLGISLFIDVD